MSGPRPPAAAARRSGVALLLLALVVPALFVGLGEVPRTGGARDSFLVAPDATPEVPSDRDTASSPLLFLIPAGVLGTAAELPAPSSARLAPSGADRLSGDASRSLLAPPPRRA